MFNRFLNCAVEKYKSVKQTYLNKSPRQKWLLIRDVGLIFLNVTGVPILDPKFRPNWFSYFPGILSCDYIFLMIYTVFYYSHDPLRAMQSTCQLGIVLPV